MLSPKEIDHLAAYMQTSNSEFHNRNVEELLDTHAKMELYPVCCPSYNRRTGKSLTIARALNEKFPLIVYRYETQKDMYKDVPNCVDVPWEIRTDNKYPLAAKRNFILDDCLKKGHKFCFQVDDDSTRYCLPLCRVRSYGHVNDRYNLTNNEFFHYWQMLVERDKPDMTAAESWNRFRWNKPLEKNMVIDNYLPSGCMGFRTDNGLRFNQTGWEDYDYWAQLRYSGRTCLVYWMCCDLIKAGGDSAVVYKGEANHTFARRTLELISKWGLGIFKLNTTLQELDVTCNTRNLAKYDFNSLVKPINITKEMEDAIIKACDEIQDNKHRREVITQILNA